jgi:hypothetical protein
MRAMPTASLRSLLLICIFRAAFACLASMQMTLFPAGHQEALIHPLVVTPVETKNPCWAGLSFRQGQALSAEKL